MESSLYFYIDTLQFWILIQPDTGKGNTMQEIVYKLEERIFYLYCPDSNLHNMKFQKHKSLKGCQFQNVLVTVPELDYTKLQTC